jgi:hypothetical protein
MGTLRGVPIFFTIILRIQNIYGDWGTGGFAFGPVFSPDPLKLSNCEFIV